MEILNFIAANWYFFLAGAIVIALAVWGIIELVKSKKQTSATAKEEKKAEENKQDEVKKKEEKTTKTSKTKTKKETAKKVEEKDTKVEEEKVEKPAKKETAKTTKKATTKKEVKEEKVEKKEVVKNETKADEEEFDYVVSYDSEQRLWGVKKSNGKKASKRFVTKQEAVDYAKTLAEKNDKKVIANKKNED